MHGFLDGLAAEIRVLDVALDQEAPASFGLDVLRRLFGIAVLGEIDDCDVRAFAREEDRDAAPDAGIATGDDRDVAFELAAAAIVGRFETRSRLEV